MIEFLRTAVGIARDTVAYLMAWWAVPVWALAGTLVLHRVAAGWPLERWSRSETTARRLAGAFLLAVARPFGRSEVRRNLERLDGQPGTTALYLAAGHGLTLYYFALLGPLLGKDVLLSHVIGMAVFATTAAALFRLLGQGAGSAGTATPERAPGRSGEGATDPAERRDWRRLLLGEAGHFAGWSLWGLAVGGLVGAAGLEWPALHLVDALPGQGLARQVVHAAAGAAAAPATLMGPVATLFAGTFLWKLGLAHAGLVAFFCAATLSPHRLPFYHDVWGTRRTARRVLALAVAAIAAGLAVALLFGLTGLEIRYKLAPGQLWSP